MKDPSVSGRERDVYRRGERGRGTKIALKGTNLFSLLIEVGMRLSATCLGKEERVSVPRPGAGARKMERLNDCHS